MSVIPLAFEEDIYPESDGQPMAESSLHLDEMIYLVVALRARYEREADVWVGGNLLFYYEEGNPKKVVAPDVFAVRGVRRWKRPKYLLWKEGGRVPFIVIEVTSESTRQEDIRRKKELYERLGVEEYILHDPLGEYLQPPLQGFHLARGRYRSIKAEADASLRSLTTGLILRREGTSIRLVDAATGELLLRPEEMTSLAQREKARADDQAARAELAAARAEQEAARAEQEAARAEQEAAARAAAEARAELEAARATALEQELERLRRQLEQRG